MPQAKGDKPVFDFTGGFNSEASPLNFPENTALDIQNLEIREDGSLRRRRRLDLEKNGSGPPFANMGESTTNYGDDPAFSWTRWETAGDGKQYIVVQTGHDIQFFLDSTTDLQGNLVTTWDVRFASINNDFEALAEEPMSWGAGDGRLFCTSSKSEIIQFEIDDTTGDPTPVRVVIPTIREYRDVEDGTAFDYNPTTLTNAHEYNLRTRGWLSADITAYQLANSVYPSKAEPWAYGWEGDSTLSAATTRESDWTRQWVATKIVAEEFGNSSAPRGAQEVDLYRQEYIDGTPLSITAINLLAPSSGLPGSTTWRLDIQTDAAHGIAAGATFRIGENSTFKTVHSGLTTFHSLDGIYTALAGTATNTIVFDYLSPSTLR